MTLAQAHAMVPGATLVGDGALTLQRVHSDTRTLRAGDLFVALHGERFDGHGFLAQARAAGAVAAVAERGLAENRLPGLLVADSLRALQELAASWRARMTLPLIAVTGSNGKTTVTQMLAGILRAWHGEAALATAGNFNNHIGVPLTVLRLRPEHRTAVVELGMNHAGEIALLARIAAPTVALVNNAQREHQEFMADVDAVAAEHADAVLALRRGGMAVLNADDPACDLWRRAATAAGASVRTFALHAPADVSAHASFAADRSVLAIRTWAGPVDARVPVPGEPMARNALAATAASLAAGAGLDAVVRGLAAFHPAAGRLVSRRASSGALVIDDSYNANPDSVRAAIDVLARAGGERWLVLGDMGEVGVEGPAFHREVGAYARERGIDRLEAMGPQARLSVEAFGTGARWHADVDALCAAVVSAASGQTTILVKGSRFMRMERVVAAVLGETVAAGVH